MNRSLSVRSRNKEGTSDGKPHKHRFTMASSRGMQQADLSKKLYKSIKAENHAISAYETAGKEQASIASQSSDWGDETGDDAISDISDKSGVSSAEIAEQEDVFAGNLEESRGVLKQIRNTESSVQPSRDHKAKISDEIQKLKYKEPTSPKIVQLEQELVRAEAQSSVAEAQLTNITRQKFKEAYDIHTAAIIERAEKQISSAKNARASVNLLDDTPIVPGDAHPEFANAEAAKEVSNNAEAELRSWRPNVEPIHSSATGSGTNAMPGAGGVSPTESRVPTSLEGEYETTSAQPVESSITSSEGQHIEPPYPVESEGTTHATTTSTY